MKESLVLFLCLLVVPFVMQAQQNETGFRVQGKITDRSSRQPVAYATVSLLNKQQQVRASGYSDESGVFDLEPPEPAEYVLEISSVGYLTKQITLQLTAAARWLSIDTIYLDSDGGALAEVTVSARKKIVEVRPGMIVYNASQDITAKGGTAADVLRRAPVLNVDAQGNVSMRGSYQSENTDQWKVFRPDGPEFSRRVEHDACRDYPVGRSDHHPFG